MSYRASVGRWMETDPITYEGGSMNLYEFSESNSVRYLDPFGLQAVGPATRPAKPSIADMFDNPEDDPLSRIAQQAGGLGFIHQMMKNKRDQDMTSLFVRTQIAVLNALANGACPCLDKNEELWLMNVVKDFIRPLTESLNDRRLGNPIADPGWNQFFADFDKGRLTKVPVPKIGTRIGPFVSEETAVARAMALNHINNDLKRALQNHGVGRQAIWDCIGKVVHDESRRTIGPGLGPGFDIAAWMDAAWDVARIRDEMRAAATQPATQRSLAQ